MKRTVEIAVERWPIAGAFSISRGSKTEAEVVVATITQDGARGRGECVPYGRYGETVDGVVATMRGAVPFVENGAGRSELLALMGAGAARNALDCALWDLEAKLSGVPVWQSAGLKPPAPALTAYTISLDTPDAMGEAAAEARARPLLKLKLGADDPVACVAAVRRGAPDARLIADPNEGWSFDQLTAIAPELAQLGLELIEQPIPAKDDHLLAGWASPILLCADESFHVAADIAALGARYGAVNIKLDKAGGFTEALACLRAAEAAELKIMVGCMVATSLAMAPAALLASAADFVDLDGPLLLKEDRPGGIAFDGSVMHPAERVLWG